MEFNVTGYKEFEIFNRNFKLTDDQYQLFLTACHSLLEREGLIDKQADKRKVASESLGAKKEEINEPLQTEVKKAPTCNPGIIKDKVEQMMAPKKKKNVSPMLHKKDVIKYARMIKNGEPEEAVKNKMIKDHFCGQSSIKYYYKRALEESKEVSAEATIAKETYVTKVKDPYSDRQKINALYAQNKTKLPLDICKQMTTWGQDLEDSEIVFRGNLLKGSHNYKDLIAAYHYAQGARDK